MRLLLDTHIFLWFISGNPKLDSQKKALIQSKKNRVFFSPVSMWECLVKFHLGKLEFPESPEVFIPRQRDLHGIESLPLSELDVRHLLSLPTLHRDPFDRMLICQAIENELVMMTKDKAVQEYDIDTI
jgi:PIN domain nuclease of toxin-antitoxin system